MYRAIPYSIYFIGALDSSNKALFRLEHFALHRQES